MSPAQIAALLNALTQADQALCNHACHGGPEMPCLRTRDQCKAGCGRMAGDAVVAVRAALARCNTALPGVGVDVATNSRSNAESGEKESL